MNTYDDNEKVDQIRKAGLTSTVQMTGTPESMYNVPGWIVMENNIINTSQVKQFIKQIDSFDILYNPYQSINIPVKDINETWTVLQKLFTQGLKQ